MESSKDMDIYSMSLDDIIKQKNIGRKDGNKRNKANHGISKTGGLVTKKRFRSEAGGGGRRTNTSGRVEPRSTIVDARERIMQKTRGNIRDARERLMQIGRGNYETELYQARRYNEHFRAERGPSDMLHQRLRRHGVVAGVPRGYVDHDNMESEEIAERQGNYATVHGPDIFDELCYEVPSRRPAVLAHPSTSYRHMPTAASTVRAPTVVIRDSSPSDDDQREYSPPRSARVVASRPASQPDPEGYRIVVSNLPADITETEVELLFEDIGKVSEVRMARPGVAEVIYNQLKDAEKAVEIYDNRKLDNQPIKCLLVKPRSLKNVVLTPGTSKKYNVDIDVGALHKALFARHY